MFTEADEVVCLLRIATSYLCFRELRILRDEDVGMLSASLFHQLDKLFFILPFPLSVTSLVLQHGLVVLILATLPPNALLLKIVPKKLKAR